MKKITPWFEIPAEDFDRAVNFYEKVLETKIESFSWESEKMAFIYEDEKKIGAISYSEGFKPSLDGVLISFNAGDKMDEIIKMIEESGGSILKPKTKIEADNFDYFCLFKDSEGNRLGLYGK